MAARLVLVVAALLLPQRLDGASHPPQGLVPAVRRRLFTRPLPPPCRWLPRSFSLTVFVALLALALAPLHVPMNGCRAACSGACLRRWNSNYSYYRILHPVYTKTSSTRNSNFGSHVIAQGLNRHPTSLYYCNGSSGRIRPFGMVHARTSSPRSLYYYRTYASRYRNSLGLSRSYRRSSRRSSAHAKNRGHCGDSRSRNSSRRATK